MDEVLKFLKENPTFYLATVDGDEPKVRPFGFVMEMEGKLYFATNNTKDVYKQLEANPKFEVCTTSATREWLRLKGKAVMDTRPEICEKAFVEAPFFKDIYKTPDNPVLAFFYIAEGEANFSSMGQPSRIIKF